MRHIFLKVYQSMMVQLLSQIKVSLKSKTQINVWPLLFFDHKLHDFFQIMASSHCIFQIKTEDPGYFQGNVCCSQMVINTTGRFRLSDDCKPRQVNSQFCCCLPAVRFAGMLLMGSPQEFPRFVEDRRASSRLG
jgi:hypothetical protein